MTNDDSRSFIQIGRLVRFFREVRLGNGFSRGRAALRFFNQTYPICHLVILQTKAVRPWAAKKKTELEGTEEKATSRPGVRENGTS